MRPIQVTPIDLENSSHAQVLVELLEHYALDAMGGGRGLTADVRARLVAELRKIPGYHGALAYVQEEAVGLINCFTGFSTFAARPLLNVHDIVVRNPWRGRGIGQALLAWAQQRAGELQCCKLTLEVLSTNVRAMRAYERAGFAPYRLDPAVGHALLMQKIL